MAANSFNKQSIGPLLQTGIRVLARRGLGGARHAEIARQVAAGEHIRDCERCRRVYAAACDAVKDYALTRRGLNPRLVLEECSRELHECERWPIGI